MTQTLEELGIKDGTKFILDNVQSNRGPLAMDTPYILGHASSSCYGLSSYSVSNFVPKHTSGNPTIRGMSFHHFFKLFIF